LILFLSLLICRLLLLEDQVATVAIPLREFQMSWKMFQFWQAALDISSELFCNSYACLFEVGNLLISQFFTNLHL
jgi:hypothetical protein